NGAAARHVHRGDLVIIANYAVYTEEEAARHEPRLIFVDEQNRPKAKPAGAALRA
ncbi:MAG: aspartate 1-decarboxylase, partial [Opitutales bacterium]